MEEREARKYLHPFSDDERASNRARRRSKIQISICAVDRRIENNRGTRSTFNFRTVEFS